MIRILVICTVVSMTIAMLCSCELLSQDEKNKVNETISSMREEVQSETAAIESSNAARSDMELSVPDDWKKLPDELNEDASYPWQNPDDVPEDSFELPETPYDVQGEGDTGEHGDTWEVPPFTQDDVIIPNYSEENLNIPDLPLPSSSK